MKTRAGNGRMRIFRHCLCLTAILVLLSCRSGDRRLVGEYRDVRSVPGIPSVALGIGLTGSVVCAYQRADRHEAYWLFGTLGGPLEDLVGQRGTSYRSRAHPEGRLDYAAALRRAGFNDPRLSRTRHDLDYTVREFVFPYGLHVAVLIEQASSNAAVQIVLPERSRFAAPIEQE